MIVEWDADKADSNQKKHGISFEEAATVLGDPLALSIPDDAAGENRLVTIGVSATLKTLVIVTTEVTADTIRIISARTATKKEVRDYEEGI